MEFKKLLSYSNIPFLENEPMGNHTGYGVGGNARYFIYATSVKMLKDALELAKSCKISVKICGFGTNLLVSDGGYNGLVICTERLKGIEYKNDVYKVACGTPLVEFIRFAVENGSCGLEALVGIPATVGGAIVMNAGAFCHTISDYCVGVQTLKNGKLIYREKQDCKFDYRKSKFLGGKETVLNAMFSLPDCIDKQQVLNYLEDCAIKRKTVQPKGRSCGSVFKNPKGDFAGRLIDQAGLKGFSIGGAEVSSVHGNFILTKKGAKATDVYLLINKIKQTVYEKFKIQLQEEIELIGKFI